MGMVMLDPGAPNYLDAAMCGPLRPGQVGIVAAVTSKHVAVYTNGRVERYDKGLLRLIPMGAASRRLTTGDKVVLSGAYTRYSDASRGPLYPGDVGVIEKDDMSDKPYHVRAPSGAVWWYKAEALRPSVGKTGDWRDTSLRKTTCSRPDMLDGVLCEHGPTAIETSHWSCCGLESREVACSNGCVHPGVSAPEDVGDCKWAAVGSLVVLAPDFASCGTAGQGPLSLGQLGIVLVNTGLEVHVKVYPDGGITWPYEVRAVRMAAAAAGVVPSSARRPTTGDIVVLSPDYGGHADAADGPLRPGDVGVIDKDTLSAQPYHVKTTSGAMWWYKAEAVKLAGDSIAVDVVARLGPVSGQWRDQSCQKWPCSRPGEEEGVLCEHGGDNILTDHWSCCGQGSPEAACTKGGVHVKLGEWRDQFVTMKLCSVPGDVDGMLCEHGSGAVMRSHWSCCGGTHDAPCAKGFVHPGVNRSAFPGRRPAVGDQVRLVRHIDSVPNSFASFGCLRRREVGVVVDDEWAAEAPYCVKASNGETWNYRFEEIELVHPEASAVFVPL